MTRISCALVLLFSSAWLGVVGPRGLAAQLAPLGPEAQLPTSGLPEKPLLAVQPGGGYVVAWDDLSDRVFSHFVAAGAEPPSQAVQIGGGPAPFADSVTATAKGFEVLWHLVNENGEPVAFYRRHLDAQGVPAPGKPVLLGRGGFDWVWSLGGDTFLAGWEQPRKHAIAARLLTSSGRPAGPELRLSSRGVDGPETEVVPLADGGFVAVWLGEVRTDGKTEGKAEDSTVKVLRARRFTASGQPYGPDFDVNTTSPGAGETLPFLNPQFQVAAAPGGGFAVAWALDQTIYLRYFDAAGHAASPEIPAVTDTSVFAPESMAFDDEGNLLLLWIRFQDDSDLQIQRFDPHGASLGSPQSVRSAASDGFQSPEQGSVAWAGDSWLVTWEARVPGQEPRGVFVRRFARE